MDTLYINLVIESGRPVYYTLKSIPLEQVKTITLQGLSQQTSLSAETVQQQHQAQEDGIVYQMGNQWCGFARNESKGDLVKSFTVPLDLDYTGAMISDQETGLHIVLRISEEAGQIIHMGPLAYDQVYPISAIMLDNELSLRDDDKDELLVELFSGNLAVEVDRLGVISYKDEGGDSYFVPLTSDEVTLIRSHQWEMPAE